MKQVNVFFMAFLMLAVLSCSNDDNTPDPPTDENNIPVMAAQDFEAQEDIDPTVIIGSVLATDADDDILIFSIVSNSGNLFEITSDGQLSLAAGESLDYETSGEHVLTIGASDGKSVVEAQITVKVINVIETLAEDPASFVTTWKTETDGETITIGLDPNYFYDFAIDWGDGTLEQQNLANPTFFEHTFDVAGTYTVAIKGEFHAIKMGNDFSKLNLMGLEQWGNIAWKTMEEAFFGCANMVYNATDVPNLEQVTSMFNAFAEAEAFNGDLNDWNVSNVTNMAGAFAYTSLTGTLDSWNVSEVENMSYMFFGANAFNGDLNDWKVDNVTNMHFMFNGAETFNADISSWNTDKVTDMAGMFTGASNFNQNISGWIVENVELMWGMFFDASAFNQNLGNWNIEKVADIKNMLFQSGLSRTNYEATLVGWSDLVDDLGAALDNIDLGDATGMEYCEEDADLARSNLINNHGWTITGDIQQCN